MKLRDYINQHYNGNLAAYARTQDVTYQQVQRWLKYGCIVYEGAVYKPVVKSQCTRPDVLNAVTLLTKKK